MIYQQKSEELQGRDFSETIVKVRKLLSSFIRFETAFKKLSGKSEKIKFRVEILNSITIETIDTLYELLRLLIKLNKKTPIETSEIAKAAVDQSANTLKKIYAR